MIARRPARAVVLVAASALSSCGGRHAPSVAGPAATSGRAAISVASAEVRPAAGPGKPIASLRRGTEITVLENREGWVHIRWGSGSEGWVAWSTFERVEDRSAREDRARSVVGFAAFPAAVVEPGPLLLAPDWGAPRYAEVEDGDVVDVLLADHDFYGVRLADGGLAFVSARSVRFLPPKGSARVEDEPSSRPPDPPPAVVRPAETPAPAEATPEAPRDPPAAAPHAAGPLESLPAGAEAPELVTRVDPVYPDAARRAGVGGEVTLRIAVEADGSVSRVEVEKGASMGMTEAAASAVRRWVYRPARVDGRPVAVWKSVRVKFTAGLAGGSADDRNL